MKYTKTTLFLSLSLSNSLLAAPITEITGLSDYDSNSHLYELENMCNNSNTPMSYCVPYGTEAASIYGELNQLHDKKESEKIEILVEHTKELIQNVYLLKKQADSTQNESSTELENINETLKYLSSDVASQGRKIEENTENLSNLSLDTTEQLADLSAKLQQNNAHFLPVRYASQAFRLDNTDIMKQLDHKIQALQQDLRHLDKKMNAGLATQAALSGLFQPDEKHKLNFTASIGGYHTQTALAVGVGYRFNKHVATRAGIAVSPSSRLTYNTAINFAW
ncbi:MAG: YadA-like family protein [Pasteurella oralis]|uniref:YadA C-terminal domain-containing protein n=1 Tax=Pasteurella oralis TaxID=1071947 RepID=UPI0026FE4CE4|nr:YadA-like family protein [Pasteurella oralis]